MVPVARLKETPVQALRLLVELYLDADIASPRKVSVWYSFWGEASSRQEYLRHLRQEGRGVRRAGARAHGAPDRRDRRRPPGCGRGGARADRRAGDPVAGFRLSERGQYRPRRGRRALAALTCARCSRAVRRPRVAGERAARATAPGRQRCACRPRPTADAALLAPSASSCCARPGSCSATRPSCGWPGDFLTGDLAGERALVVRDERGRLHAFRNTCRRRPHALVTARTRPSRRAHPLRRARAHLQLRRATGGRAARRAI